MRMCGRMRKISVCVFLGVLIGIIPPLLSAQQNQNTQKSNSEIEALKQRVSELAKPLQTVENVEKMELQAKLAEANAKIADTNAKFTNVQFDKFKLDLRVDNDDRMRAWSYWFFSILGIFVVTSGAAVWFSLKTLIANSVEKYLNGFKEAVDKVELLENRQRLSERARTTATLEDFINDVLVDERNHFEQIKGLQEGILLDIFDDEGEKEAIRYKAAEVLVARKSPRLVTPMLKFLNLVVDSESNIDFEKQQDLRDFTNFFAYVPTQETHDGLDKFLNRLLTENLKHCNLFLTVTVFSLAWVSLKLNIGDSVSTLRLAIPGLEIRQTQSTALKNLARYFDKFDEPASIKESLTNHGADLPTDVKDKCLELMGKYDREFVEEWRARKAAAGSEA